MRRSCLALLVALALCGCARREGAPAVTAQVGGEGGVPAPVAVAGAVGIGVGLGVVLLAVATAVGSAALLSSGG